MAWIWLLIAGCFEILGVVLLNELNRTNNKLYIVLIAIAFVFSFSTLKMAMNTIPMGTAYAIWTGIGTAGGTIIGMLIYRESTNFSRILCLLLIILSVVGLKLVG
ncbi:DMT family transporter [Staphylococcus simiae]|uniref:SugE protein n=1 Tax=Staphylococcus simiae CCM 7213 = CCUG 51256 TaxID=911238 RepID=G5JIY2_9STAP|nr:multidrug efflux SMR transporter [Staphylococcus simiae]EHJ07862.1 sugE protein [Staphylococcus simiae CCM 7213 = CCUG 51256]PNZ14066.1 QacE family quaternary ammonium compound efflux SMR transporter [Staphylococcus simiae]SNV79509.1 sugE protein [Staphylococcus simiae]